MKPYSIAVIGSGIAGLSAAWLLSQVHRVTVYEAANYLGGHSNTIDVETSSGRISVDTGFIVYNPLSYPNLCALFDCLAVPTKPSRMTFAFSTDVGRYEYSGTRAGGLFGQLSNLINPLHWRMLSEVGRFFRQAEQDAADLPDDLPLGDYLQAGGYSTGFIDNHLLPMAAAIWSARAGDMTAYPAKAFIRFFANHGLLQATRRPQWRTVDQGAREYVIRLDADGKFEKRLSTPVERIRRNGQGVVIEAQDGSARPFDHVVLACHADQALAMLDDATSDERNVLGAFGYSSNLAVVHRDVRQMPARRRLWSSWNYLHASTGAAAPTVTYWMNSLQGLACKEDIFVSLNPGSRIENEIARFNYTHPMFTASALKAQHRLWGLQGERRTWFCGSYFGAGFHEDALQSGLAVAEQLGGVRRPWQVAGENGRIHVHEHLDAMRIAAE